MDSARDGSAASERRYFGVEEFVTEVRRQGAPLSRNVAYAAVRAGTIPSVRVGKRYMIPVDALDRMLARGTCQDAA